MTKYRCGVLAAWLILFGSCSDDDDDNGASRRLLWDAPATATVASESNATLCYEADPPDTPPAPEVTLTGPVTRLGDRTPEGDECDGDEVPIVSFVFRCEDAGGAALGATIDLGDDLLMADHDVDCTPAGGNTVSDPAGDCVDPDDQPVTCPPAVDISEVALTSPGGDLIIDVTTSGSLATEAPNATWIAIAIVFRVDGATGDPTPGGYWTNAVVQVEYEFVNGVEGVRVDQFSGGAWGQPAVPPGLTASQFGDVVTFVVPLADLGDLAGVRGDPSGSVLAVSFHSTGAFSAANRDETSTLDF